MNLIENHICLESVDSTNEYVKRNGLLLPDKTVVSTKHQTAGKGRLGRSWQDKEGESLLCSWLFKELDETQLTLLPMAAGLAVQEALQQFKINTVLKWSNDILGEADGSFFKIAGILCESRIAHQQRFAVCGIGINLLQPKEFFLEQKLYNAGSLQSVFDKKLDQTQLLELLTQALYRNLTCVKEDCAQTVKRYSQSCITLHKTVKIDLQGKEICAIAQKIAPDGSLICCKDGEEFTVRAGEVSVRGIYQ